MNYHIEAKPAIGASLKSGATQGLLMCDPEHFGVDYVINPWMENHIGRADGARARIQWENLRRKLAETTDVVLVAPQSGLPDMVFTANAGLAIGRTVVLAQFHAKQRREEEGLFRRWFEQQGFHIAPWPRDVDFEGAGDALMDLERNLIWCGYGWRSSARAPALLQEIFQQEAVALKLQDPRFYHLDTCFCPLADGTVIYYPAAFDPPSLAAIRARVHPDKRIEIDERDAQSFACNAVLSGGKVFLNDCSIALQARLTAAGLEPVVTPLSEFLKAGGAAKCLTLQIDLSAATSAAG